MACNAAIVLVPGSFGPAYLYDNLLEPVRSKGVELVVVDLVTVGRKPGPLPTMYDDAANIAAAITKLADEGKDVVVVGHSYGGTPATQSTKGLSKKEREAEGKKGGVVRLGYMTAVVGDVGMSVQETMGEATGGFIKVAEDGWMEHVDLNQTAPWVSNHLSPEAALDLVSKFEEHSSVSFINELTHGGYNDVPVSWLFCEDDKCIPPTLQQSGIDRIEKSSGRKVDVTRLYSDHIPSASHPEESIQWLVGLAEKGGN